MDAPGNRLGAEGAAALVPALMEMKGMTELNLESTCALWHCIHVAYPRIWPIGETSSCIYLDYIYDRVVTVTLNSNAALHPNSPLIKNPNTPQPEPSNPTVEDVT